jgi:hypothetical protein
MRCVVVGVLVVTLARGASAQAPTHLELVRCVAGSEVPCLRARIAVDTTRRQVAALADSERTGSVWRGAFAGSQLVAPSRETASGGPEELTFGAGAIGIGTLARSAASGSIELDAGAERTAIAVLMWRPPLIAMPAFQAVAEPSTVSPALREALLLDVGGSGNRPMIALCVALLVTGIWLATQRLGWRDLSLAVPASRERSATTRTGVAPASTEEGAPRRPEDITHQTARRTALHR